MSEPAADLLETALRQARLSARGMHRIRAVALTIADLEGLQAPLEPETVALAMSLRGNPIMEERAYAG